jgi:hypothetical protein
LPNRYQVETRSATTIEENMATKKATKQETAKKPPANA